MSGVGKTWTKRGPKITGRKSGTFNKMPFHKVVDVLIARGLNPTEELLKVVPVLEPEDQAKIWMFLITYTQARPPSEEIKTISAMAELADKVTLLSDEELIKSIRADDANLK